jgi:hypothetical protein
MAIGGSKNKSKTTQQTTNPFAISAYQNAQATLGGKQWTPLDPSSIDKFMNPYNANVVSGFTALNDQARRMALNSNTDNAIAHGAFGGTGRNVENALTNSQYDQNSANFIANLLKGGYDTALSAAQTENANINEFPLAIQQLLLSGAQGTQENSQGKSSGLNLGFSWTPKQGWNA